LLAGLLLEVEALLSSANVRYTPHGVAELSRPQISKPHSATRLVLVGVTVFLGGHCPEAEFRCSCAAATY